MHSTASHVSGIREGDGAALSPRLTAQRDAALPSSSQHALRGAGMQADPTRRGDKRDEVTLSITERRTWIHKHTAEWAAAT